ncbi:unnamed protein product, partial [Urochloa humidicola]
FFACFEVTCVLCCQPFFTGLSYNTTSVSDIGSKTHTYLPMDLKEQLTVVLRENVVLKRAVAIQYELNRSLVRSHEATSTRNK